MDVVAFTRSKRSSSDPNGDETRFSPLGLGDPNGEIPSQWFSGETQGAIDHFLSQDLDILLVSIPLTPLTENSLGLKQFRILSKRKAIIVNVARGPIINSQDLCQALNEEVVGGAALDVTDPEPLPKDHPLWSAKNIILTPHVSGDSANYMTRLLDLLSANLARLERGQSMYNVVNRKTGY